MDKIIKELKVTAIENGTVIDHIPASVVFRVIRILSLEHYGDMVLFATNLESKKYGTKGIIKVANKYFRPEELNKIALVAPHATIIEIKNHQVQSKQNVEIPDEVLGIVKCFNPNCITNLEQVSTRFAVVDKDDLKLKCHYCEKITRRSNMEFK